jgi:hypothetical protein
VTRIASRKTWVVASGAIVVALAGCTTFQPTPRGYAGPTSQIVDSVQEGSGKCAAFFFLQAYDGHSIENALSETERRNYGRGFAMDVEDVSRTVPSKAATFHINGQTHCAAPVVALASTVYSIEGDVTFEPRSGARYIVKGELVSDHSAVWIEDEASGKQCGNKLRVLGSTALNRGTSFLLGPAVAKAAQGQKVEEIPPPPL